MYLWVLCIMCALCAENSKHGTIYCLSVSIWLLSVGILCMRAVVASTVGLACKERLRQPIWGKFTQDQFYFLFPFTFQVARAGQSLGQTAQTWLALTIAHAPTNVSVQSITFLPSCTYLQKLLASIQTANGRREACNMLCVKGLARTQNLTILSRPALCQLRQEHCTHTYMIHARYMHIHAHTYISYLDIFGVIVL